MKLQKHEVCVFIENESQLQEARELLEKYGEKICENTFYLYGNNYVQFDEWENDWFTCDEVGLAQITLSQLEEILKEER